MLANGLDKPQNCSFPRGISTPSTVIHGSLGSPNSALRTASQLRQLALQKRDQHTQTHKQTDHATPSAEKKAAITSYCYKVA